MLIDPLYGSELTLIYCVGRPLHVLRKWEIILRLRSLEHRPLRYSSSDSS